MILNILADRIISSLEGDKNPTTKLKILSLLQKIPGVVVNKKAITRIFVEEVVPSIDGYLKTEKNPKLRAIYQLVEQYIPFLDKSSIATDQLDKMEVVFNNIDDSLFKKILALYTSEEIDESKRLTYDSSPQEFNIIDMVKENPSMKYIYDMYKASGENNNLTGFIKLIKDNKNKILNAILDFNKEEGKQSPYFKKKNEQTRMRFINYDLKSLKDNSSEEKLEFEKYMIF